MRRGLKHAVVVITGASSGIGRATAVEFARAGASLALAARRAAPLEEVCRECEALGAHAVAVPTDVTDEAAVQKLAEETAIQFGRIDVWINNAGVTAFGAFEDTPPEVFRRVLEVNFFGYVHGARAVWPYFRQQQRGVLINNASMVATLSEPFTSAYVTSKHAIRGLGQSLRQELTVLGLPHIQVCTVMPATIDTPFFQHAANWTGRAAKAMPPVYPPERVARTLVRMAVKPRREVFVGNSARQMYALSLVAPGLVERLLARRTERTHLYRDVPAPTSPGNLFRPLPEGTSASGGWKPRAGRRLARAALVGAVALAPAILGARRLYMDGARSARM